MNNYYKIIFVICHLFFLDFRISTYIIYVLIQEEIHLPTEQYFPQIWSQELLPKISILFSNFPQYVQMKNYFPFEYKRESPYFPEGF